MTKPTSQPTTQPIERATSEQRIYNITWGCGEIVQSDTVRLISVGYTACVSRMIGVHGPKIRDSKLDAGSNPVSPTLEKYI